MNIFKRLELYVSALFKLGKTERLAKATSRRLPQIENRIDHYALQVERLPQIENRIDHYALQVEEHQRRLPERVTDHVAPALAELSGRHSELARGYSDLTRRLDRLVEQAAPRADRGRDAADMQAAPRLTETPGFDAFRQSFYHRLENRYRGTLADIRAKLRVYLPDVEAAFLRTGEKPVLDLGCGRGEWLELLHAFDIPALGVDTNAYQIEDVLAAGHNVKLADAVQTLKDAETGSYSAITAFHLVEHLPFEIVLWMTREALRVLAPGGILLIETPNVRNVLVGATSFHNDPTHLRPLTDPVLEVLFETCGYEEVDIRRLNPHERLAEFTQRQGFDDELAYLMFGPQDVAILGRKPLEADH